MGAKRSLLSVPLLASSSSSFLVFWTTSARLAVFEPARALWAPTLAAAVFWASLVALVLAYPLRGALAVAAEGLKKRRYLSFVIPAYFSFHMFVYGILLERLLVGVFGVGEAAPNGFDVFFSLTYVYHPANAWNALLTLTVQPSIVVLAPPYYSLALGPFAMAMGVVITVLVAAGLHVLGELVGGPKRIAESIAIPALGVVGGGSCCLSIPVLLEYFSPALQAAALTPAGSLALNTLYYALPLSVAAALKLAVDGLGRACRVIGVANGVGQG